MQSGSPPPRHSRPYAHASDLGGITGPEDEPVGIAENPSLMMINKVIEMMQELPPQFAERVMWVTEQALKAHKANSQFDRRRDVLTPCWLQDGDAQNLATCFAKLEVFSADIQEVAKNTDLLIFMLRELPSIEHRAMVVEPTDVVSTVCDVEPVPTELPAELPAAPAETMPVAIAAPAAAAAVPVRWNLEFEQELKAGFGVGVLHPDIEKLFGKVCGPETLGNEDNPHVYMSASPIKGSKMCESTVGLQLYHITKAPVYCGDYVQTFTISTGKHSTRNLRLGSNTKRRSGPTKPDSFPAASPLIPPLSYDASERDQVALKLE